VGHIIIFAASMSLVINLLVDLQIYPMSLQIALLFRLSIPPLLCLVSSQILNLGENSLLQVLSLGKRVSRRAGKWRGVRSFEASDQEL
jgi:hypothetical protein